MQCMNIFVQTKKSIFMHNKKQFIIFVQSFIFDMIPIYIRVLCEEFLVLQSEAIETGGLGLGLPIKGFMLEI